MSNFTPEHIRSLEEKVAQRVPLTDAEFDELKVHVNTQKMSDAEGFDLGETSAILRGGNIQEEAVRRTQKFFAGRGWQGRRPGRIG